MHGIENPIVSKNTQNLTDHLYKLSFVKDTVITHVNDEDFPDIMFKFENFKALNAAKDIQYRPMFGKCLSFNLTQYCPLKKQVLIMTNLPYVILDVIGLLHVDQPPNSTFSGEKISCTLWSSYVDQLLDCLNQQPLHPTVAIMQFCQGAVYNGIPTNSDSPMFFSPLFSSSSPISLIFATCRGK